MLEPEEFEPEPADDTRMAVAEKPRFEVIDVKSANWVVGKVLTYRKEASDAKLWLAEIVDRAARAEQRLLNNHQASMEVVLSGALEGKKAKSIALPAGRMGFRKSGDKLVVTNESAVIEWAKTNCPDAVRVVVKTTETVDKARLDAHFRGTGEVPTGCAYETESEKFYVENTKEK